MVDYVIAKESREILRQFSVIQKDNTLLCPILKVLQMRHADFDALQATRVMRNVLDE